MFNEWHYARSQIEDIELGRRLRQRGHRILLSPDIQGTHLKRWTLRNILVTDFTGRGVPWTWLILREGALSGGASTLNLRTQQKWCTFLAGAAAAAMLGGVIGRTFWPFAIAAAAVVAVLLINLDFYRFLRRHRSLGFAMAAIPIHIL